MDVGLVCLHAGIAAVALLVMLNGHLHGARKVEIDAGLSVAWVGLLVGVSWAYGWKAGLAAVGFSFVYAIVCRAPARAAAGWLLSHPPK